MNTKEFVKQSNWNDTLLDYLFTISKNMKAGETVNIALNYGQIKSIIKGMILENINVDLCEMNIMDGIELRRQARNKGEGNLKQTIINQQIINQQHKLENAKHLKNVPINLPEVEDSFAKILFDNEDD